MSSTIIIRYDGDPIEDHVIWAETNFESQLNALPGLCSVTVRDIEQDQEFITGKEIELEVDGQLMWAGWLTQVVRTHTFPADDTDPVVEYENRRWVLSGVDFNILFDKRVFRNASDYLHHPDAISGGTMDGEALRDMLASYIDVPAGFDTTTFIDDIVTVASNGSSPWSYVQQGSKMREQFEQLALRSAAVYYIDADKNFHYHAIETTESRWGFSDVPNYQTVTASPVEFQGATWGFREVESTEDGSQIVNDALIWGGSEWAGTGGTVFARTTDSTSVTNHGRWQIGEVHFGEAGFGIQQGVDARADAIVLGPPGADAYGQTKGLRFSQWAFRFAWHDKDVPIVSSVKDHIRPGQLVTIELSTFSVTKLLPLRSLRISFPESPDGATTHVRFDGEFGLQLTDPFTLWRYLLRRGTPRITVISTATDAVTSALYGSFGQFEPSPSPDGSTTVFSIPFGYIAGTTNLYKEGLIQRLNLDYTESDPEAGEITFVTAPGVGNDLWLTCRTLAG